MVVISGRAAFQQGQDLLGEVTVATGWESAVPRGDLKRGHDGQSTVQAY